MSQDSHTQGPTQNPIAKWLLVIVTALTMGSIGWYFKLGNIPSWIITLSFTLLGVGFGLSVSSFLQNIKTWYLSVLTLGVALCGILATLGAKKLYHKDYVTCAVCGYQAVNSYKAEEGCGYCFSDTWRNALQYEDLDYEDWLRREQFEWFGGTTPEDTFDRFHPLEDDGFKKDTSWRPVLVDQDFIDSFNVHTGLNYVDSLDHSKGVYIDLSDDE